MEKTQTYVALLRGINVGGHKKVPMAELRDEMADMGYQNVKTLLNSGNVIFDGAPAEETNLENEIGEALEKRFGFPIPVLIRKSDEIQTLIDNDPFTDVDVTKEIRLYITFLKEKTDRQIDLPWISHDGSFRIVDIHDRTVCSILDLSISGTIKGMEAMGELFGNNQTTRNWNTIHRIAGKL